MADEKAAKSTPPSDATLKDFVAALGNIAAAVEKNTAQLQAAQQAGGFDRHRDHHRRPGERFASIEQRRTVLDYRVLDALVGRTTGENLVVNASRSRNQDGADEVTIFGIPSDAAKVSVQAVGADRPELISLGKSGGANRTVALDATRDKDIARLELLNHAGEPIRLGPRLARLPAEPPIK